MNALVLSNINALRAIRRERRISSRLSWDALSVADARRVMKACAPNQDRLDMEHLDRLGFLDESDPSLLHVLVGSSKSRRVRRSDNVVIRVISRDLPSGSIMQVEPGLYAVSPAFAALQFSLDHSYEATFMLLMELLGTYALPEQATFPIADCDTWGAEDGTLDTSTGQDGDTKSKSQSEHKPPEVTQVRHGCEPATTLQELRALSRWAKSSKYATFRKAVRHVRSGSASVMESILYGVFGLPMSHGGFACNSLSKEGMQLNKRIDFDSTARAMASGIPYAICDAYIHAARTALEYNGEYHETPRSTLHDAKRNNGLKGMGISVIVITREQMCDIPALEAVARSLYRAAGKRFRYRVDGYRIRQQNLLNGLRKGAGLKAV